MRIINPRLALAAVVLCVITVVTSGDDVTTEPIPTTTMIEESSLEIESKMSKTRNKLTNRLQSSTLVRSPFHGLMSTATGLLAAVGGGYLLHAAMVTLFQNYLDPAFDQAVAPPVLLGPHGPVPVRRTGPSRPWGDYLDRLVRALKGYDYPEATFRYLNVETDGCRKRAVCELQQVLRKGGFPKSILANMSSKIPGMEKYRDAIWWGAHKENCKGLYVACPYSLSSTVLKAFGFS